MTEKVAEDLNIALHAVFAESGYDSLTEIMFRKELLQKDLRYLSSTRMKSEFCLIPFTEVLFSSSTQRALHITGYFSDCVLYYTWSSRDHYSSITCAGLSEEMTWRTLEKAKSLLKKVTIRETDVSISFLASGRHGMQEWERQIEVPAWEQIKANYSGEITAEIDRVMKRNFTIDEGKLLLLYGPPGTGKTFVIRALLHEWRDIANCYYVVDPENYFSNESDYMLTSILNSSQDNQKKLTLLIFEDTGELLQKDAREQTGQGLSRLLNIVDGLIGQGMNLVLLITTNEPLKSLHPAVARPGRCLARIEFPPLLTSEANAWLKDRGYPNKVAAEMTIAELYALLHEHHIKTGDNDDKTFGQYL